MPETCTVERLERICLEALGKCDGFAAVERIVVGNRPTDIDGSPNWSVASVRPRVDNASLRGARDVIEGLQRDYRLEEETAKKVA